MKNLSSAAKIYILGILIIGFTLIGWMLVDLDWANWGLYLLAALGAAAQTAKVEGPNDKTNYNIAWFVYGFTFITLGAPAALFVIAAAHLVEWIWHKYPWFIQSFNIATYGIVVFLAGLVYRAISSGSNSIRSFLNESGTWPCCLIIFRTVLRSTCNILEIWRIGTSSL